MTVQTTFRAKQAGPVKCVALLTTAEGQNDQKDVDTLITTPQLKAEVLATATGTTDVPINYTIRLTNPGTGDLDDIQLIVDFDVGLGHDQVKNPDNDRKRNILTSTLKGGLKAGGDADETLV